VASYESAHAGSVVAVHAAATRDGPRHRTFTGGVVRSCSGGGSKATMAAMLCVRAGRER